MSKWWISNTTSTPAWPPRRADDAKTDVNNQLKNEVEGALNLGHFKDFKVALLSRPLRDWYQRQQDLLVLLPLVPTTNQPQGGASPPLPPR